MSPGSPDFYSTDINVTSARTTREHRLERNKQIRDNYRLNYGLGAKKLAWDTTEQTSKTEFDNLPPEIKSQVFAHNYSIPSEYKKGLVEDFPAHQYIRQYLYCVSGYPDRELASVLFDFLQGTQSGVAGSALLRSIALNHHPVFGLNDMLKIRHTPNGRFITRDIDIWVPYPVDYASKLKLFETTDDAVFSIPLMKQIIYQYFGDKITKINVVTSMPAAYIRLQTYVDGIFTVSIVDSLVELQFILLKSGKSVSDVVQSFDIEALQFALTVPHPNDKVWQTKFEDHFDFIKRIMDKSDGSVAFKRLESKELSVNPKIVSLQSPYEWCRTLSRFEKYAKKYGWNLNRSCINRLCMYFRDSCTDTFFKNLLTSFRWKHWKLDIFGIRYIRKRIEELARFLFMDIRDTESFIDLETEFTAKVEDYIIKTHGSLDNYVSRIRQEMEENGNERKTRRMEILHKIEESQKDYLKGILQKEAKRKHNVRVVHPKVRVRGLSSSRQ